MSWLREDMHPDFHVPAYTLEPCRAGGYNIRCHDAYGSSLLRAGVFSPMIFKVVYSEKAGRRAALRHTKKKYAAWLVDRHHKNRKPIHLGKIP